MCSFARAFKSASKTSQNVTNGKKYVYHRNDQLCRAKRTVNTVFTCAVYSDRKTYLFVAQLNRSTMSKISKSVSKAKSAFDEKTVNNPTLSEQKIKAGKRKGESEPIFPRKKVRQELRVSKNRSIENRFT